MSEPKLPNPGKDRFWVIEHQPLKKTTPLRVELRERLSKDSDRNLKSLSRLIGTADTIADTDKVYETAETILVRAGNSDAFVGTWNGEGQ